MADKPIKVALLEGDFAVLSLLGFPLGLTIQLQQSNFNLADALWTAKSSKSGFSVSFYWPAQVTASKTKRKRKRRKSKQAKAFINAVSASSHKEITSKPDSKVQRELSPPKAEVPNNATHSCAPTENQLESFQQDSDEEVVNDEGEWTVVKRKKPRDTGRVSKTLLKLRAPRHVWENMSSSESSCPSENEVDDAAAPVSVTTPDHFKSPSPIVNRLRPRLRPKK